MKEISRLETHERFGFLGQGLLRFRLLRDIMDEVEESFLFMLAEVFKLFEECGEIGIFILFIVGDRIWWFR